MFRSNRRSRFQINTTAFQHDGRPSSCKPILSVDYRAMYHCHSTTLCKMDHSEISGLAGVIYENVVYS